MVFSSFSSSRLARTLFLFTGNQGDLQNLDVEQSYCPFGATDTTNTTPRNVTGVHSNSRSISYLLKQNYGYRYDNQNEGNDLASQVITKATTLVCDIFTVKLCFSIPVTSWQTIRYDRAYSEPELLVRPQSNSSHILSRVHTCVHGRATCLLHSCHPYYQRQSGSSNHSDFSKKEEFRRYLEKTGVLDALTKVLVGLYEGRCDITYS